MAGWGQSSTRLFADRSVRATAGTGLSRAGAPAPHSTLHNWAVFLLLRAVGRAGRGGGVGHAANGIAGDYQFHAAVLLAAFRGIVGGHGLAFSEAAGGDRVGGNALLHQVVADGIGALLREPPVVFVAADAVGVTFDRQAQALIGEHDARYFGEPFPRAGQQLEAATLEENVRHVGDQTARRVAGGENGVELLQESGTHFLLFFFGLLAKLV